MNRSQSSHCLCFTITFLASAKVAAYKKIETTLKDLLMDASLSYLSSPKYVICRVYILVLYDAPPSFQSYDLQHFLNRNPFGKNCCAQKVVNDFFWNDILDCILYMKRRPGSGRDRAIPSPAPNHPLC
jgi:hypothetical protein